MIQNKVISEDYCPKCKGTILEFAQDYFYSKCHSCGFIFKLIQGEKMKEKDKIEDMKLLDWIFYEEAYTWAE